MQEITFPQMVQKLAKSGEQILLTLTPEDCHFIHMIMGVCGEVAELVHANSIENAIEEHGDIEFYMEGLRQGYSITYQTISSEGLLVLKDFDNADNGLIYYSGELLDLIKKYTIYRKSIDKNLLIEVIKCFDEYMNESRIEWGITRDQAIEANMNKLIKGEKARYKDGEYSDQAAQNRADKQ